MIKGEIIRSEQIDKIYKDMQNKRVAYFCAHTGWGKTTLMHQYFAKIGQDYEYTSCIDDEFREKLLNCVENGAKNIVIDDMQEGDDNHNDILEAISKSGSETKFYILGRCVLPPFLKPLYITGAMVSYEYNFFVFKAEEVQELFELYGKSIDMRSAKWLSEISGGWLLGLLLLVKNYEEGADKAEIFERSRYEVFEYFNERLWSRFSDDVKSFLIQIGHLKEFTVGQAQMICGMNNVNHIINKIMSLGSFLEWVPAEKYEMMKLFHKYLSWKQKTEYPKSFVTRLYENTALYFTLKNDIMNALKYYKKANNKEKVAELLLKNAEKHAGNGYFCKLKEYYFSIPESIVENTPELMCALSMIFSILCDPDRSEMYYSKLKSYADRAENKTQRRLAQEKIAYLNIALPHRGISGLEDIFEKYAPIAMSGHLKIQNMSVTGNMPGVINGGKDFCRWTKNDRDIYKALKTSVGVVLGKNIRGIMDIALGESLFEKNADLNFTEELTLLNSGYYEAEASGNIQLQFASIGVMALIYASIGKLESASDAVKKLKNRIDTSEEIHDNIDAFLVNLSMLSGSCEKADEWLEEKAPDESKEFYIIDRYRYLTKIKVYIVKQMYNEALSLLDITDKYFNRYERIICHMEALVIKSIILYRTGDSRWKDILKQAVSLCGEYKFIRVISQYGVAVLEMLKNIDSQASDDYFESLLANTQKQAVLYPKYLSPEN